MPYAPIGIARYIDHTLLKPDATVQDIGKLCDEAREYGFFSVCVNPVWVMACASRLADSKVKVCSVVGFPLGANMTSSKVDEALRAFDIGAAEIDMVINIGLLKSGWLGDVGDEIRQVRKAVPQAVLKVIIETCLLNRDEKISACKIAKNCGADFVKTSTGFSTGGATVEDVALMRKVVGDELGVKASGGIRDYATAKAMLEAGANRLGCSASVAIVRESKMRSKQNV